MSKTAKNLKLYDLEVNMNIEVITKEYLKLKYSSQFSMTGQILHNDITEFSHSEFVNPILAIFLMELAGYSIAHQAKIDMEFKGIIKNKNESFASYKKLSIIDLIDTELSKMIADINNPAFNLRDFQWIDFVSNKFLNVLKKKIWKKLKNEISLKGVENISVGNITEHLSSIAKAIRYQKIPYEKVITDIYGMSAHHTLPQSVDYVFHDHIDDPEHLHVGLFIKLKSPVTSYDIIDVCNVYSFSYANTKTEHVSIRLDKIVIRPISPKKHKGYIIPINITIGTMHQDTDLVDIAFDKSYVQNIIGVDDNTGKFKYFEDAATFLLSKFFENDLFSQYYHNIAVEFLKKNNSSNILNNAKAHLELKEKIYHNKFDLAMSTFLSFSDIIDAAKY